MPRQEFTSPEPKSDIYSLMLMLAAVFTLAAIVFTYVELAQDYKFYCEDTGGGSYSAPAPVEAPAPAPAPVSAPAAPAAAPTPAAPAAPAPAGGGAG